jgi:AcrR family transcriptional regulator
VEASTALFLQHGYAGTGLKLISTQSDAPIGSLYHFFPGGKEELAAETLRASGAAYQALVEAVFDGEPDPVSAVLACFRGAAEALRLSDYADACPVATVALEVASSDEALRVVAADVFESWLSSATKRLRSAGVAPAKARQLGTTFVAALEGGFLLSRVAKSTAPMEAIGRAVAAFVEAELPAPSR